MTPAIRTFSRVASNTRIDDAVLMTRTPEPQSPPGREQEPS
jgi:hypothetical protein